MYVHVRIGLHYYVSFRPVKFGVALLQNSCMGQAITTIILAELSGEGAQWNTIFTPLSNDDDFLIGHAFLMLIADSIIYMVIAW